jgi:hypothetical protein
MEVRGGFEKKRHNQRLQATYSQMALLGSFLRFTKLDHQRNTDMKERLQVLNTVGDFRDDQKK